MTDKQAVYTARDLPEPTTAYHDGEAFYPEVFPGFPYAGQPSEPFAVGDRVFDRARPFADPLEAIAYAHGQLAGFIGRPIRADAG